MSTYPFSLVLCCSRSLPSSSFSDANFERRFLSLLVTLGGQFPKMRDGKEVMEKVTGFKLTEYKVRATCVCLFSVCSVCVIMRACE